MVPMIFDDDCAKENFLKIKAQMVLNKGDDNNYSKPIATTNGNSTNNIIKKNTSQKSIVGKSNNSRSIQKSI
jgi:hypothetical protein